MKKGVSLFLLVVAVAIAVSVFSLFISGAPENFVECTPHSFNVHGQVVNSTFGNATSDNSISVNVSVYTISFNNGEPSRAFLNVTNATGPFGNFSLVVGNATNPCSVIFVLEAVTYDRSSNLPLEAGPSFPPLPKTALITVLDNLTIYTSNATLLNLTAVNSSWGGAFNITFNYIIFDDSLGFPIAENFATSTTNATVVVPSNRNYTVLFMRAPSLSDPGSFANAVPPIPYTVNLTQNPTLYHNAPYPVKGNMTFGLFTINGTVNVTGNRTSVNVTNVLVKLGIAGMMPPNSEVAIPGGTVITPATGGNSASGYYVANYSVTAMGASNGIFQVIEWYASNTTQNDYFAYFQNFTIFNANVNYNVVLQGLAGTNSTKSEGATSIHTRFVAVNITDDQGQPLTDANMEMRVNNPGHKDTLTAFRHMIFSLTGGVSKLPLLNTSNATLRIFNKRFAPSEIKLNVTNASLYPGGIIQVQLSTFKPRQFNPNGTVQDFNSSQGSSSFRLVFMRNSAACNVYNASISACRLGKEDFDVGRFDPLKAMVGGKVNIYSEINTTRVIIYFIGVDMIASGPPEASMSDQPLREAQSASGTGAIRKQIWRFGSAAPPIYDKVLVGIPYNDSKFNRTDEYALFNISFDYLLDNNGNVIWNSTAYPNGTNIPDAYSDYAANWTNASSIGMKCVNETGLDASIQQCYVNTTTNYIWLNLPHFTDGDPGIEGQADTTPPAEAPRNVAVSTNLSSGSINVSWTDIDDETGESYIVYRFTSNISVFNHSLTNITPSRVAEGIGSFLDNTTVGNNATAYYYAIVAVDSEGNLNTSSGAVNLTNSVNATVNDTITPKSPTGLNFSASGTTVTLTWLNVTQDVNGNPDAAGMRYKVYRSGVNATNATGLNLSATTNVTRAISSATMVCDPCTTNTTPFSTSTGGTGTYHFIVTSLDDNGNENLSFQVAGANFNYFNVSLNETAASSPSTDTGSSSSGGGGGGGATPKAGTSQSRSWDSLSAGSAVEFKVTKAGIPVKLISFKVSEDVTEVEVTVTVLSKLPSNVKEEYGGTVYSLLSIAKSNLKDTSVSSVAINFSVEKKWLTTNSANAKDIVLVRYDRNKWNELTTTLVNNDSINYNYVADSPGMSTFAISVRAPERVKEAGEEGTAAAAGANASQKLNESETVSGEAASKKGKKFLYIAIVLILIAVAGGIVGFIYYRRSKGSSAASEESSEDEPAKPQQ